MKQLLKQYFILIDESGTLPDPEDRFVVITGVGVRNIKEARNLISRILKLLRQRKIRVKEVKFYYAGERTKKQILSGIVSAGFEVFTVIIDKKGRKIADTPENFALAVKELINEIKLWHPKIDLRIIIDKHFHKRTDEAKFNEFLRSYTIQHTDSQQNYIINLADFAAGALLAKYNRGNAEFYDIVKDAILFEKIISWPELKKKSLG